MSLQKFLSFADVFSNPFYFKVHGNDKLGTKPGFCLTLVSITIGIVAFIFLLEEMQQMKDPIVNVQTIQTLTGQSYTIPPGYMSNVVGMADKNYNPILNSISKTYFTIHFEICDNGNCTIVNSEKCSDQLTEIIQQQFGADVLYFQYAYCMNQTYQFDNSILLSGGIFSISSSRVFIITERCSNSTANDFSNIVQLIRVVCATEEELDEKLQDSYIIYGMQNYRFDPDNVAEPFQPFYYMASQEVVVGNPISIFFNYQISEIITKTNFYFFFPQQSEQTLLQMQSAFQDKQTQDDTILGKAIILLSNDRVIRTRSYKNILNLFGTLGGLMNIVFYIAKILIIPVNWLEQRFYLYNSVLRQENLEDYLKLNEKFKLPQLSFWDLLTKSKLRKKFFQDYKHILPKLEINYLINQIQLSNKISETFSKGDFIKNNYLEESKPIFETKKNETIWNDLGKQNIYKKDLNNGSKIEIQQRVISWEQIPNEISNI